MATKEYQIRIAIRDGARAALLMSATITGRDLYVAGGRTGHGQGSGFTRSYHASGQRHLKAPSFDWREIQPKGISVDQVTGVDQVFSEGWCPEIWDYRIKRDNARRRTLVLDYAALPSRYYFAELYVVGKQKERDAASVLRSIAGDNYKVIINHMYVDDWPVAFFALVWCNPAFDLVIASPPQ